MRTCIFVVALASAACSAREIADELTGSGSMVQRRVLGFDRPVDAATLARAQDAVINFIDGRARVSIEGQHIVVEGDNSTAFHRVDALPAYDPSRAPLAWVEIVDHAFTEQVSRRVARDATANKLEITSKAEIDPLRYLLVASDRVDYVNSDWANKHHCDLGRRIEGTGVPCTVTGDQRISAWLRGEPGLFVDPPADPALAIPADRELVFLTRGDWRGRDARRVQRATIVESASIALELASVRSAQGHSGHTMTIALSPRTGAAVLQRIGVEDFVVLLIAGERQIADVVRTEGHVELLVTVDHAEYSHAFLTDVALGQLPRFRAVPDKRP